MTSPSDDALIAFFDANIDKLSAKIDKGVSDLKKFKQQHQDAAEGIEAIWGKTNVGESITNIFKGIDKSVLNSGAESLGVFGKGLEALGPAGLAAAAGVAAFGLSLEQAKQAAEFAENLEVTANKLGLTTNALQEWNFAAVSSGVGADAFAAAVEGGNAALGKFKSNANAGRVKKIFAELGITKEEADKANGITDLLPEIADKIKNFSVATQTQIAKGLGMEAILPILQKGSEGIEEMTGKAHELGAVMDTALVQKGAEGAEKLKEAGQIITTQLHVAFVQLIPVLVQITNFMAGMAKTASVIAQNLGYALSGDATGLSDANLNSHASNVAAERQRLFARVKDIDPNATIDGHNRIQSSKLDSITSAQGVNQLKAAIKSNAQEWLDLGTEVNRRTKLQADANAKAAAAGKTDPAALPDKTKKGPSDQTTQLNDAVNALDIQAGKALDEAKTKLANTLQAQADAQSKIVADDLAAEQEKIQKQRDTITKAAKEGKDSNAKAQLAILDEAAARAQQTAKIKDELIARNMLVGLINQSAELEQQHYEDQTADYRRSANYYGALASLATTTQQRQEYENQAFAAAQKADTTLMDAKVEEAKAHLAAALAAPGTSAATIKLLQDKVSEAQKDQSSLGSIQAIQSQARAQDQFRQNNPLYAMANPTESINQSLQNVGVQGLQSLSKGIADAIVNAKNMGQVFHDVSKQIIADLLQIGIQRAIVDPLANMLFGGQATSIASSATPSGGLFGGIFHGLGIPGFATGTDSAPGGLAWVGENGKELVNLPRGSQVIPNAQSMNLAKGGAGGGQQVNINTTTIVQADQSVLTSDITGWIAAAHSSAIKLGAARAAEQLSGANRNNLLR